MMRKYNATLGLTRQLLLGILLPGILLPARLWAQPTAVAAGPDRPPRPALLRPLLRDDQLAGWRVAQEHDFREHGEIRIQRGELVLRAGQPATGVAFQGAFPQMNYELSWKARRLQGHDFFAGLTFPYGQSHCTFIAGGWGGGVIGLSNVDGLAAVENDTTGFRKFEQDRWYAFRLRVTPEEITVWIDGQREIVLKTAGRRFSIWWEQEPMRPLGFASWNTTGAVRDVLLRDLSAQP